MDIHTRVQRFIAEQGGIGTPEGSFWSSAAQRALAWPRGLIIWGLALIGLALALYLAPLPTLWVLALIGLGIPLFWLVYTYPVVGLVGLVFLTAGFLQARAVNLRLPIGALQLRDLVLLGMLGLVSIQGLVRRRFVFSWWSVSGPLLLFIAVGAFSAVYGVTLRGTEPNWAFGEFRALMYYSVFFIVVWTMTRRSQLTWLLIALFVLADVTTLTILLQQFLGLDNPLLSAMTGDASAWRVWQAGSDTSGLGAVRVIPPGHVLIYTLSIVAFALALYPGLRPGRRLLFLAQFAFLNVGLILTYTRAQWIASAIALALVCLFAPRGGKAWLMRYALVFGLLFLVALSLTSDEADGTVNLPLVPPALVTRATSVLTVDETLNSYSLQWRIFEVDAATRSISANPILGVGLGNHYRDLTTLNGEASGQLTSLAADEVDRFTRYVHSSYLYIAVKMGLVGLFVFVWWAAAYLLSYFRRDVRQTDEIGKYLIIAFLASFVGMLFWFASHSHLMEVESAATVGLVMGLTASVAQLYHRPDDLASAPSPAQGQE